MNLVERYIEAIKFWLPAHLKDDVAAELADDIRSEIEDAEREKGRRLTDDEIAAILKARGRPMIAASHYLPKRALIGPELYPIYIFVLKIVALCCLIPPIIMWVIRIDLGAPFASFGQAWGEYVNSLLMAFAVVTIIFAVIEYQGINPAKPDTWNPKALRPVKDPSRIRRSSSVGEIAANMVMIAIFAAGYLSKAVYDFKGGHVVLCPEWVPYWQIILVLAVAETALAATNLFKPFWSGSRIMARAAIDLAKIAAFTWLLQAHVLREVSGAARPASDTLLSISDIAAQHAFQIAIVIAIVIAAMAIWRLWHLRPLPSPVAA
jgi:hypothetical protein